jgi:FKBP-type peptidyl-prolyl cis-trans isomerase SlyD
VFDSVASRYDLMNDVLSMGMHRVWKAYTVAVANVQPGMQFHAQTSGGHTRVVTVTRVAGDMVTVDGNHPLAGENLNFAVEVTEVREATEEELSHGHVHGPGGHHHHDHGHDHE